MEIEFHFKFRRLPKTKKVTVQIEQQQLQSPRVSRTRFYSVCISHFTQKVKIAQKQYLLNNSLQSRNIKKKSPLGRFFSPEGRSDVVIFLLTTSRSFRDVVNYLTTLYQRRIPALRIIILPQ